MTPRERLLRTLRRERVDRVPISTYELVGWNPDHFENRAPSYRRLMDRIRADTDCLYMWGWNAWADSELWDTRRETRPDGASVTHARLHTPLGDLTRASVERPDVHTVWTTEHLLKGPRDVDAFLRVLPDLYRIDESRVPAAVAQYAEALERLGDRGILMNDGSDPSACVPDLFEFGLFTTMCYEHRDKIVELIDAFTGPVLERLRLDAELGFGPMIRLCGPEYYTPPYLPPPFFEEMVLPSLAAATRVFSDAGIFVRAHCHGRIREALPHIVAAGAHGLDPIEPPPDGDITLREVKERYGERLVLFGNTELKMLEHGAPEQIREAVREQMNAAKAGGGYVIMPTAAPINEPLSPRTERNYFAWIDAALEFGAY
ncbi:MAG TPA: uroporphyrinogen decarboxylase family protein [Candidatus Hydrogenedentes bacterium]|nr:uroporphyrinogen decarboxylase family protein [Candidatus Hydrogenedentota bacterium]HNT86970.1 uroporphyrinogen decarboxylase family protein [Candidatus Hydrogenedentota bacterium]